MTPDAQPAADVSTTRRARLRLGGLIAAFVAVAVGLHLSGWSGPERLQGLVESAGWAGVLIFVLGYALLVLVPTPASVLTILGGALFGLFWGVLLAWTGALLGALGGFAIGRRLGRSSVDRLLHGRLRQADRVLSENGLVAVLAVRLLPLFPFTPLNYAAGLLGVRVRHYLLGTGVGMLPGVVAYTAVGASGADLRGLAVGVGGLLGLTIIGGTIGRRLLARSAAANSGTERSTEPPEGDDAFSAGTARASDRRSSA